MKRQFTAVIERRGKWYVAFVQEIPGLNTQGETLIEVRRNRKDALTLVMETNKGETSCDTLPFTDAIFCVKEAGIRFITILGQGRSQAFPGIQN